MKNEIMWAIVGNHGFYTGTALTRKDMIAEHCWAYYDYYPNKPSRYKTMEIWKERRKAGDRAIKVEICPIT